MFKEIFSKSKQALIFNYRFLFFVFILFFQCKNSEITKIKKPNILIILADDMGYSDAGFMGSGIETPSIDLLANNGLVFNQFYNAGRCCPTRASLLTGLYAHKSGLGWMTRANQGKPGYQGEINNHSVTLAQVLKTAGYKNYAVGKWHVVYDPYMHQDSAKYNWPLQRGFDKFFGMLQGGGGYYNTKTLTLDNTRIKPPKDFYITEGINAYALKFLKSHFKTQSRAPFFMYLAHYAPHRPLHAQKELIAKYKGKFMKGWDYFRKKRLATMKEKGLINPDWSMSKRDANVPDWDSLTLEEKKIWDELMAVYAAQVDHMDQGIGQVIQLLKENKELDNTLILFLSDNGGNSFAQGGKKVTPDVLKNLGNSNSAQSYRVNWANMSNTPFRKYKMYNHEGGISTPLIIHWPKGISNSKKVTQQQGHVIDIMPTLIEISGAKYPKKVNNISIYSPQGTSFLNAIKGKETVREPMFFEHNGNRAVIKSNWKLVAEGQQKPPYTKPWELYNLSKDRIEENNLINQNPEKAKELEQLWNSWAKNNNVLPINGKGWFEKIKEDINEKQQLE